MAVRTRSISTRLFLWLFCSGFAALLIGAVGLYLEVRSITIDSVDHNLETDLEIFTGLLHFEDDEIEFEYAESTSGQYAIPRSGHYYEVFLDGESFVESISLGGEQLRPQAGQLIETREDEQVNIYMLTGPAHEHLRVMEKSFSFDRHQVRIIVAHSLAETWIVLQRFRTFLLFFVLIGTLVIAWLGREISRRSLQPLTDFSHSIDRISDRTLDQRIDPDQPYQEFDSLGNAFNAMLDRLQKAMSAREELLSEVSHELKTPVTVIRSYCDVYLQKKRSDADYVEALKTIRDTTDGMGHKIRRLLNIAQSDAELLNAEGFSEVPIRESLASALLTVRPLALQQEIEIVDENFTEETIFGNRERLVEAFSAILENAVKYNRTGGSIRITTDREGDSIRVDIEDSGCGITPGEEEQIFSRFHRGSGVEEDGTGLGLYLVKAIVEAHGGSVSARNLEPSGSCFTVSLPRTER